MKIALLGANGQLGTDLQQVLSDHIVVPFTRAVVPSVDLAAGRLVIDPPPGLLDGPERARGRDEKETA